jgi:hypothetical protein
VSREDDRARDDTVADRDEESVGDPDEGSAADDAEESSAAADGEERTEAGADTEADSQERAVDQSATSFVEVEQELGHLGEGMRARAQAIDVEQVDSSAVPDDYPVAIETPDALELTLELPSEEGKTVLVYFEWPEQGVSDRLATLLELCDVPVDRFGDLHGQTILVTVENGYYLPVIPEEGLRGDPRAIYALAAGMAPPAIVTFVGIFGIGSSAVFTAPFVALWLVATLVVVPLALYSDAWYLRTHSDWEGGPLFWATLSMLPLVEIAVVPLYLFARGSAEPLG